jgi:hypothetical protein
LDEGPHRTSVAAAYFLKLIHYYFFLLYAGFKLSAVGNIFFICHLFIVKLSILPRVVFCLFFMLTLGNHVYIFKYFEDDKRPGQEVLKRGREHGVSYKRSGE